MSSSVARVTEITASSSKSFERACEKGIERACTTLKNVRSAWVQDMKMDIEDGKITTWRVNMKVTFVLEE